jgi:hypothetical protein
MTTGLLLIIGLAILVGAPIVVVVREHRRLAPSVPSPSPSPEPLATQKRRHTPAERKAAAEHGLTIRRVREVRDTTPEDAGPALTRVLLAIAAASDQLEQARRRNDRPLVRAIEHNLSMAEAALRRADSLDARSYGTVVDQAIQNQP